MSCPCCRTKQIKSSLCRRAGLLNWCIAAFRWIRLRICCRHPRRIDRPAEFCLHRKSAQPAGRSLRYMAATLASTTAGLLNGIFGEGPDLHVAGWESIKVTDRFEETDENEVTTIRERERFTQSLTLVYTDGTTSILDERSREP
jgi:hypothetical protein